MANLRLYTQIALMMIVLLGIAQSVPLPGGGHGGKHTHFIIKVPHFMHTHHHTHTKKIYIPVKSHDSGHHDHSDYEAAHGW